MKPDPRIFEIAAERLQVQARECIFVDDKADNLQGARRVGMTTIQFRNTDQCIASLISRGIRVEAEPPPLSPETPL